VRRLRGFQEIDQQPRDFLRLLAPKEAETQSLNGRHLVRPSAATVRARRLRNAPDTRAKRIFPALTRH